MRVLLKKLADEAQKSNPRQIVLALVDGRLRELFEEVEEDKDISFVTTAEQTGFSAYKRTTALVLQKAVYDLYHGDVEVELLQTTGKGQFLKLRGNITITEKTVEDIKKHMDELIARALPIVKRSCSKAEAVKLFSRYGMGDKASLFYYRRSSYVNTYILESYRDYFYGFMMPDTSYVKWYDLVQYHDGLVLVYPDQATGEPAVFVPSEKLFTTQRNSALWGEKLGVKNIAQLNDAIATSAINDLMLMQEAEMESRIGALARQIVESPQRIKYIMIAGPSSSGKTTFSHRLSIHLRALGITTFTIGLDDYYKNREDSPKDENGEYDFERLDAIDVEQFNIDMERLGKGERVELPKYNFLTGKREYGRGHFLKLHDSAVLVIEGIHGLNEALSYRLPHEEKFKIYISALTQLAIDEHNALPTTDGRLIRRIVRDARTRGTSARSSIARWPSVRRGEEKYIFPYQEEADYIFNSALIYELAILKVYAEPLLFSVPEDGPEYLEANRLLKFLDYLLPMPSENVNHNSLLREFIGGSCFNV